MIPEAIVFDRDGVLADFQIYDAITFFQPLLPISLKELTNRWEILGNNVGFPRSVLEEKSFFVGFWNKICDELDLSTETRQCLLRFNYTQYMKAYSDAFPAMTHARQQKLKVGVLSNFALASLDASLEAIGLHNFVDIACAAPVIGSAKPQPEAYLTICHKLNVKPKNCLFFDDEIDCVEGARTVGMKAFHVDRAKKRHQIHLGIVRDLNIIPEILACH
ncbi:MAG: HAD-IA family hydrolase [Chloroflexota bacterium]